MAGTEEKAEEALRRLAPLWTWLRDGPPSSTPACLEAELDRLPDLPDGPALEALDLALGERLARWECQPPDLAALGLLLAQAGAALAAARALGEPERRVAATVTAARALHDWYLSRGEDADLDLLIRLVERAGALPATPSRRAALCVARALALRERYLKHGDGGDLDTGVRLLRETVALDAAGPVGARARIALGRALRDRYLADDDPPALEESIRLLEEVAHAPLPDAERAECLSDLGLSLYVRYMEGGDRADLDRVLALHRRALLLLPAGLMRPRYLNNLGIALDYRYLQQGDPADLDERVQVQEQAYALSPGRPDRRNYASNLGNALYHRYLLRGDPADLERRIRLQEEAVLLTPGGPARPQCRNNLANARADRYSLHGDPADLDAAIALVEEAIALTSGGPYLPMFLSNCGRHLWRRFALRGDPADLERSIALLRRSIDATPGGPERAARLLILGSALRARLALDGRTEDLADGIAVLPEPAPDPPGRADDLADGIAVLEEALAGLPAGPDRPDCLAVLGELLGRRGTPADHERQRRLYAEALELAGVVERPALARTVARLYLDGQDDPDLALRTASAALQQGVVALERMLAAADEEAEAALLGQFGDLYDLLIAVQLRMAERAATAAEAEMHRRDAYLAAESGKGRRAAALLATRAARPGPGLAARLEEVERLRRTLAQIDRQLAGARPPSALAPALRGGWLAEAVTPLWEPDPADGPAAENLDEALHARLTERGEATWRALQALLEEIARSDPQYAAVRGFAPPHPPEGIARALPEGGALLLLYPLDDGLACFVLRRTVAGMDLRVARAPPDRATLAGLVAATFPPSAGGLPGAGATLDAALLKLARALYPALAPLLPPFDPERPATLVMAPTGALHRLPLHACPWPDPARRVLDGYVVSYATTADVLLLASRKPATPAGVAALAPGLPSAAGRPPLVGSLVEACVLAQQGGASPLLRRRANLAALLREHGAARKRWVLLATHGRAGGRHAARSGLLFYDEQGQEPVWLSAAEILGRLDLEGAEHLGVTACSTHADDAAPGDRLAGLLRALLYRGARSVQATLWPVRDDAALLVSAWTWEQLLAGGRPGPARSGAPGKRAGWPGVSLRPHARVGAVCAARRPIYRPLIRRRWPVAVVVRGPRAQSRSRFPLTGPPIPETMARRCWRCAMPLRISGCRWDTCKWTVGGIPRGPPPIGA